MSNLYRKLATLIKSNGLNVEVVGYYDLEHIWIRNDYNVYDGKEFITNLSGDMCCFDDDSLEKSLKEIEIYLEMKDITTIESFQYWLLHNYGEPEVSQEED